MILPMFYQFHEYLINISSVSKVHFTKIDLHDPPENAPLLQVVLVFVKLWRENLLVPFYFVHLVQGLYASAFGLYPINFPAGIAVASLAFMFWLYVTSTMQVRQMGQLTMSELIDATALMVIGSLCPISVEGLI
jgi:hypothetical protein